MQPSKRSEQNGDSRVHNSPAVVKGSRTSEFVRPSVYDNPNTAANRARFSQLKFRSAAAVVTTSPLKIAPIEFSQAIPDRDRKE